MRIFSYTTVVLLCVLGAAFVGISLQQNEVVPESSIKIMTYNIGTIWKRSNQYDATVASIIKQESPDIVLLQEAFLPKAEKLAQLLHYKMLSIPGEKRQHVQILSRYPLKLKATIKLDSYDGDGQNVVCAEVETEIGQLLACSVYLTSVRSEIEKDTWDDTAKLAMISLKEIVADTSRSKEAEELLNWLDPMEYSHVVIGGDFNSLFLSKAARTMRNVYGDSSCFNPSLFTSSHKIQGLHLPVKVDYIFLSDELSSSGTKIIKESPGDHYPVITNVHLN